MVAFFVFCGAGHGSCAIEAVEDFRFFLIGNTGAVILYADGDYFLVGSFGDEEEHCASGGCVGQGIVQKNMAYLLYPAHIAGGGVGEAGDVRKGSWR